MSAVFISYRRSGAKHSAYRLKDKLKQAFGAERVFIDLEDIDAGLPFADVIRDTIGGCSVVLIVIGPKWLEMQDMQGSRRLDGVDDWVRQEIEAAMASDARVIPVLVDGATELVAGQVPESLREFAGLQAMRLHEEETYWNFDVDRLIEKILVADPGLKKDARPTQLRRSGKAISALVVAVLVTVLVSRDDAGLDHDAVVGAIVLSVIALILGILGFRDIKQQRFRGRGVAIGGIVLASLAGLAAIGSLREPGSPTMAEVDPDKTGGEVTQRDPDTFDPNLLPPTAAIPSAPREPDISGSWLSSDGSRIKVDQHGERFEFLEFEPSGAISATGSGLIRGNQIQSTFRATDNSSGSGQFRLSGDGKTISGSYTESATGDTVNVILSRH
jgi:hypothetical protein